MPVGRPWRVLAAAAVLQTGSSVVEMGLPVVTGFIKSDLHLSASIAGFGVSSYLVGKLAGSYLAGRAADRLGETKVLVAGAMATGVMCLIAIATSSPVLFVIFGLAGLAGAGSTPAGGSLVRNAFPAMRRGVALGIRQTGIPVGGLVAAGILPWIAHAHGWRWSIAVAALLSMVAAVPLMCSKAARSLAFRPSRAARVKGRVVSRDIRLLTIWGAAAVTGQFALLVFIPLDLHQRNHWSLAAAATFVAVLQGAGVVGRIGWGWISDRTITHGRKPLLMLMTVGAVGALLVLAVFPGSIDLGIWIAITIVGGLTLVGFQGLWVTMLTEAAHETTVGAAMGFALTFTIAGGAIAPPAFGALADATGTYRSVWAVLAALLTLSMLPVALLGPERSGGASPR